MKKTKQEKGITLVALIITIIVLLILAVVTIRAVQGDGIISKAKDASNQFELAQEKEELQLVVLEWQLIKDNGEATLESYLVGKYGEDNVQLNADKNTTITVPSGNRYIITENGEVTLLDGTIIEEPSPIQPEILLDKTSISREITRGESVTENLTATLNNASGNLSWTTSNASVASVTGNGKTATVTLKAEGTAIITVSYDGKVSATCAITVTGSSSQITWTQTSTGDLAIGSIVKTSTNEEFYVIGGDTVGTPITSSTEKVILLAKNNLKSDGSEQDTGAMNPCAFSSTNYWSSETSYPADLNDTEKYPIPEGATSIITIAKSYGASLGATGRLMTVEEVEALGGSRDDYSTSGCPAFVNSTAYWLGSAHDASFVWGVYGSNSDSYGDYFGNVVGDYGVRPVIEVLMSSMS